MARKSRSPVDQRELAGLGGRLKTVTNIKFHGRAAELVAATGVSQPTWSRVLAGRQAPSWKLLAALIDLGVSLEWVLTGRGSPFGEAQVGCRPAPFFVSKSILPGHPEKNPENLVELDLHLGALARKRSRYWLEVQPDDPITREPRAGIRAGDLLQLETDSTYWLTNLQRLRDSEIGAFHIGFERGQLLALGTIDITSVTPGQPIEVTADIFGFGAMPVDVAAAVCASGDPEASCQSLHRQGRALRSIIIDRPTSASAPRAAPCESTPQARKAELLAVAIQLWRR